MRKLVAMVIDLTPPPVELGDEPTNINTTNNRSVP